MKNSYPYSIPCMNSLGLVFITFIILGRISLVDAQQKVKNNDTEGVLTNNTSNEQLLQITSTKTTATSMLLSAILSISGVIICFTYYRFMKISNVIIGFYTWGSFAWMAMINSEQEFPGYGKNRDYLYLGFPIFVGLLGCGMFWYWKRMGWFFVGILGGCACGITALSVKDNGLFGSKVLRTMLLTTFGLAGLGIMFLFNPKKRIWPLTITSGLCGSFATVLGIDQFLHWGFTNAPILYVDFNKHHIIEYKVTGKLYSLLGGFFILAVVGFCTQLKILGPAIMQEYETQPNDHKRQYAKSTLYDDDEKAYGEKSLHKVTNMNTERRVNMDV